MGLQSKKSPVVRCSYLAALLLGLLPQKSEVCRLQLLCSFLVEAEDLVKICSSKKLWNWCHSQPNKSYPALSVTIGPPNWRKPVRSSRIRTLPKMMGYHVTIFNGSHYSVWSLQTHYVITLQREITRSNLHTKIHTLSYHTTAWDNKDGPTNQRPTTAVQVSAQESGD